MCKDNGGSPDCPEEVNEMTEAQSKGHAAGGEATLQMWLCLRESDGEKVYFKTKARHGLKC